MPEAETWRYRGQTIDREQVSFLREFIREHPHSSRWKLSRQLCETLGWKQANGALRDVVCRGLLLMLERAGEIELPPVRWRIVGQRRTARPRPAAVLIDTTPLTMPLGTLGAIEIQLVRRTADEPLFHSLMEQFHYLRYEQPVGEHLKYLVWAQGGRWPVWRGVRRRGTWRAGTASSAGAARHDGATSVFSPTTRAF